MMSRCLAILFAATLLMGATIHGPASASDEPHIVTITGKISKSNRGALDPFLDSLFKFHEKEFKSAFGLSYSALAALPQATITVEAENWPAKVTASGPKLVDVLKAAGVAEGARLGLLSLDGYALEFEPEKVKAKDWILAIRANGKPLNIGGRGPGWLLYDTGGKPASEEATGQWVYQLFLIEAL